MGEIQVFAQTAIRKINLIKKRPSLEDDTLAQVLVNVIENNRQVIIFFDYGRPKFRPAGYSKNKISECRFID
jgi:hypothetical protein